MGYNIAIDGPAGAGKSTIAKLIAKELGFVYIDTGAMYRAISLFCIKKKIDFEEEKKIEVMLDDIKIDLKYDQNGLIVYLCGEDVSTAIRQEAVGMGASVVSRYRCVREKLTYMQREIAAKNDVVMDGRDIGTTVLPDANLKIYLTASADARAKRRYDELVMKGQDANLDKIKSDIMERDYADMHREISPLVQADDAILIDSSDMSIDEVVQKVRELVR